MEGPDGDVTREVSTSGRVGVQLSATIACGARGVHHMEFSKSAGGGGDQFARRRPMAELADEQQRRTRFGAFGVGRSPKSRPCMKHVAGADVRTTSKAVRADCSMPMA